jgi:hypothetical protein
MFPNVRLMIAATVASVVMLGFGFGVFAAFRINHEPFGHLPSGAAPLQFAAANTVAASSLPLGAGPAFGPHFEQNEGPIAADVTGALAPTEPAPAVPTAEVAEQPMPELAMTEAPAMEAAPAPEPPAATDKPADQAALAQPDAQVEPKAIAADKTNKERSEQDKTERSDDAPKGVAARAARARHLAAARKAAAKQRLAAALHRPHKPHARIVVQSNAQNAFGQQSFGAAAAPAAQGARTAKLHRPARTSGVGGPFVSPPPTQ